MKTKFPLPNAVKPRYIVSKKLEINELPDDVLLHIFRFLTPIDLLNIGVICRRWHAVSQDESLWRSLVFSYGLHRTSSLSTLTNKQRIQNHLNRQIRTQLKTFFTTKFDPLKSFTGIPDYQKIFTNYSDRFEFILEFCDDKHRLIWSQKCDTIKFFETSLSIRWLDLEQIDLLARVQYLRLYAIVFIEIDTRPVRHRQRIQSLLHEYAFNWNSIKTKSTSITTDLKSPIRLCQLSNEDDCLIALYEQDKSFAFLMFNLQYLAYRQQFFAGLRVTKQTTNQPLSQSIGSKLNDIETSVFICFRNMTTVFLRHRFPHCRLKPSTSTKTMIELIRITDMNDRLGPELDELPKFNWKTNLFKGSIHDLFFIDLIILNEENNVSFAFTLPATLTSGTNDQLNDGKDYLLSSNIWHIKAISQYNNQLQIDGTIMRLDSEYCALGKDNQSWHLQNMTCSF